MLNRMSLKRDYRIIVFSILRNLVLQLWALLVKLGTIFISSPSYHYPDCVNLVPQLHYCSFAPGFLRYHFVGIDLQTYAHMLRIQTGKGAEVY